MFYFYMKALKNLAGPHLLGNFLQVLVLEICEIAAFVCCANKFFAQYNEVEKNRSYNNDNNNNNNDKNLRLICTETHDSNFRSLMTQ